MLPVVTNMPFMEGAFLTSERPMLRATNHSSSSRTEIQERIPRQTLPGRLK